MSVSRETLRQDVSRETRDRLDTFVGLLLKWQRTLNLVSAPSVDGIWTRHIDDSLGLIPLLPDVTSAIDLGSGAGFPGLILAIATGIRFQLVEADQRKAAFLAEAARLTHANVVIRIQRAETLAGANTRLLTARAFRPLVTLLAYSEMVLGTDGVALFPKGRRVNAEIAQAHAAGWRMKLERRTSVTGDGVILRISEITRA